MNLTSREREMIQILLDQRDFITMEELSEKMQVSSGTLYREVPLVSGLLKNARIALTSVSKKGVKLDGSPEARKRIREELLKTPESVTIEPLRRVDLILLYLLDQDDCRKIQAIAGDLGYAFSTVRGDLKKVDLRLAGSELAMVHQKGLGIFIEGSRMEKNHLITEILTTQVDEMDLYRWLNEAASISDPFLLRTEACGLKEGLARMHRCLKPVFATGPNRIEQIRMHDYLVLVLLLSFMLCGRKSGEPYSKEMEIDRNDVPKEAVLERVLAAIRRDFTVKLDDCEVSYVRWAVMISVGRDSVGRELKEPTSYLGANLSGDILRFVEHVENQMGIGLFQDPSLREGLFIHMEKAIRRIRCHLQIVNPLLGEIREQHGELYHIVRAGVRSCFPDDYFPGDEIGYITQYFAVALDQRVRRIFQILVVCSAGMGSSRMLAASLTPEIPEIGTIRTTSFVALEQEDLSHFDLILSTIPLDLDESAYLRVSPMLHPNELRLIQDKILRHKRSLLKQISEERREEERIKRADHEELFLHISQVSRMAASLIGSFRCFRYEKSEGVEADLALSRKACGLEELNSSPLDPETIKTSNSAFIIPGTTILYREEADDALSQPIIFTHRYETPGILKQASGEERYAASVYTLYPSQLQRFEKKALHGVVAFLIEDTDFRKALMEGDEWEMKGLMAMHFRAQISDLLTN